MTAPIVAVIGGGQLARMMTGPATELGVTLRVLVELAHRGRQRSLDANDFALDENYFALDAMNIGPECLDGFSGFYVHHDFQTDPSIVLHIR